MFGITGRRPKVKAHDRVGRRRKEAALRVINPAGCSAATFSKVRVKLLRRGRRLVYNLSDPCDARWRRRGRLRGIGARSSYPDDEARLYFGAPGAHSYDRVFRMTVTVDGQTVLRRWLKSSVSVTRSRRVLVFKHRPG